MGTVVECGVAVGGGAVEGEHELVAYACRRYVDAYVVAYRSEHHGRAGAYDVARAESVVVYGQCVYGGRFCVGRGGLVETEHVDVLAYAYGFLCAVGGGGVDVEHGRTEIVADVGRQREASVEPAAADGCRHGEQLAAVGVVGLLVASVVAVGDDGAFGVV